MQTLRYLVALQLGPGPPSVAEQKALGGLRSPGVVADRDYLASILQHYS